MSVKEGALHGAGPGVAGEAWCCCWGGGQPWKRKALPFSEPGGKERPYLSLRTAVKMALLGWRSGKLMIRCNEVGADCYLHRGE